MCGIQSTERSRQIYVALLCCTCGAECNKKSVNGHAEGGTDASRDFCIKMPMDFLKRILFISWYIIGRTKSGQGGTNRIVRGFCRGSSEGKNVRPTTQLSVFLPCLPNCSFQSSPCPQNSIFILLVARSFLCDCYQYSLTFNTFSFLPHLFKLYLLSSFCLQTFLQDFSSLCEVVSFEYIWDARKGP